MLSNRVSVRKNFSMGCINNSLSLARKYRDQIFVHASVPTSGHISRGRFEVNYELRRTGNEKEKISQLIVAPDGGYWFFLYFQVSIFRAAFNIGEYPSACLVTRQVETNFDISKFSLKQ